MPQAILHVLFILHRSEEDFTFVGHAHAHGFYEGTALEDLGPQHNV